ncbi:unnamed protein product [Onchocerca flexuosa]|uniref:Ovule protein n=1 Tax=Onchocerca flexuosa TaxID=387005 RepID=A0A183H015_9BILA|nr:unnamed protein product [Onchocerca flexuosa]
MKRLIIQQNFRIHSICRGCHRTYCNWRTNYHVAEYQPAKTLQRPATCSKKLMSNVVETTILTGLYKGEDVLVPTISTDMPF